MREFKVYVRDENESKQVQEHLFNLGYRWLYNSKTAIHLDALFLFTYKDGDIMSSKNDLGCFKYSEKEELSAQEVLALEIELVDKEFYVATTHKGYKWLFQKRGGQYRTSNYYKLSLDGTDILLDWSYVEYDENISPIRASTQAEKQLMIDTVKERLNFVFNEQTQMFEEPQHKNWRAKLGGKYKSIVLYPEVIESEQTESNNTYDKSCYETGNYYPIDEDIDWRIAEIKAIMEIRDEQ